MDRIKFSFIKREQIKENKTSDPSDNNLPA